MWKPSFHLLAPPLPWYGNFVGPGPINISPFSPELGQPVNAIDQAARLHDYVYYNLGVGGFEGALFKVDTLAADIKLVKQASAIVEGFRYKIIDNVTGKPIDYETFLVAEVVADLFTIIIMLKESGRLSIAYNAMKDPVLLNALKNVIFKF